MKIVIVDDSKAVHAFLREMLDGMGITLQHFYDGQEVVDGLNGLPSDVDLVLLDWEMPRLTGIEALPKIRAARPDLRVVMMTSKNAMSDIVQAMELGAQDYVMKPFTRDILIGKLEAITGKKVA